MKKTIALSHHVSNGCLTKIGLLTVWLSFLTACHSLPDNNLPPEYFEANTSHSLLAKKFAPEDYDQSAVLALSSGAEAFVARQALIRMAEVSLDLQYYIWHDDATGRALAGALLEAADRGVRVRVLIDDLGANANDDHLAMFDSHPNISIRLFNPIADRDKGLLNLAFDFGRINHRMHNKSITADNAISIVGGRNIGDEYFATHSDVNFADLDVAVIGKVVQDVSDSFDLYWNYKTSFPINTLNKKTFTKTQVANYFNVVHETAEQGLTEEYVQRLTDVQLNADNRELAWFWGDAHLLSDHPEKALSGGDYLENADRNPLVTEQIGQVVEETQRDLLVVSPYFVPGKEGVQFFSDLVKKGVSVTVITNSLAATDVAAVHAGYAKYRKPLLKAGVNIYEMRPDAQVLKSKENTSKESESKEKKKGVAVPFAGSSSGASLHAKAFFFDGRATFIGSLNLDPRSVIINTEVGVLLENEEFTLLASSQILNQARSHAYQVSLDADNNLQWIAAEDGEIKRYDAEPNTSWFKRFSVGFIGLFPIDSQL